MIGDIYLVGRNFRPPELSVSQLHSCFQRHYSVRDQVCIAALFYLPRSHTSVWIPKTWRSCGSPSNAAGSHYLTGWGMWLMACDRFQKTCKFSNRPFVFQCCFYIPPPPIPLSARGRRWRHIWAWRRRSRGKRCLKCCDLTHGNQPFCMKMEWRLGFGEQAQFKLYTVTPARLLLEDSRRECGLELFLYKHPSVWCATYSH